MAGKPKKYPQKISIRPLMSQGVVARTRDHLRPHRWVALETMNHVYVPERREKQDKAQFKRCPFFGRYVQGRAETFHKARITLRNAMVRHVLDEHPEDQ